MKMPGWLRLGFSGAKSDELRKVRQRTDQMLKRQEAQREQEIGSPEREMVPPAN
jgi:hypothetical protein